MNYTYLIIVCIHYIGAAPYSPNVTIRGEIGASLMGKIVIKMAE